MRQDLEKRLYEKYPKIFRQKDWPISATAMSWGICCGDGWYSLIDGLCGVLQHLKEKFGSLRVYADNTSETQAWLITLTKDLSHYTCEMCGQMNINGSCERCTQSAKE